MKLPLPAAVAIGAAFLFAIGTLPTVLGLCCWGAGVVLMSAALWLKGK